MKWKILRLTVSSDNGDQRLDLFLAENCTELSRSLAKKIIDLGGVHVNGRRVRSCSLAVKNSDRIEVYIDHFSIDPYRILDHDIVYQDSYLIVLNKPPGIDTQPTHARYKGTLYEALQWHLRDSFRPHLKPELGMVQRLDRGTSGLIAFSIHPRAHKKLTELFVEHRVEKRYLALVTGVPEPAQAEIRSCLARSRKENRVKSVDKGGKEAITRYRIIESFPDAALLDINLLTGRSHQIRAHMSEQGHPLLGDQRYGGPQLLQVIKITRPLLHAASLRFNHPVTGGQLDFTLPMPADMQQLLTSIKTK